MTLRTHVHNFTTFECTKANLAKDKLLFIEKGFITTHQVVFWVHMTKGVKSFLIVTSRLTVRIPIKIKLYTCNVSQLVDKKAPQQYLDHLPI